MPTYNLNVPTGGAMRSTETLSGDWFGAIQTGFHEFDGFDAAAQQLDVGLMRWPGGTLSELRPEVYGMEHEGLFDPHDLWRPDPWRERPDLAESMDYAIENDMAFSVIIPTVRYKGDLAQGEEHLRGFLDDLFTGEYGALPDDFTLELGNEYFALDEFRDDPASYGEIASSFAEIIGESAEMYLTPAERAGLKVAVQMGDSTPDNDAILGAFSPDALAATNSLVFHSLPISLRNLNKENASENDMTRYEQWEARAEQWTDAIHGAGGTSDPDLFMSAWTVGNSTHNPARLSLEWQEYGMRSASVAVESVAGYSSIGVDSAAIWGLDVTNLNSVTSTDDDGNVVLSHTGEIFDMMAEALPGSTYLGTFTPHSRDDAVMNWTFGDGQKLTNYVSINDLTADNDEVLMDFGGAQNIRLVSAEMLSTELEPGYSGSLSDTEARLHEVPVRYDMNDLFTQDGIVIDFDKSFEMAEVVVELGDGLSGSRGNDWIAGDWQSDRIDGNGGNDFLVGGRGYDRLIGGKGNDELYGGNGKDRLYGNMGDDTLSGGDGDDVLAGGSGRDVMTGGAGSDRFQFSDDSETGVIRDFEPGADRIDLRGALQDAGALNVRHGSLQQSLDRAGSGDAYELRIWQDGNDAILRLMDGRGDEALSLRVQGVNAGDLSGNVDSVFDFGSDFSDAPTSAAPLPLPISRPAGVPATDPAPSEAAPVDPVPRPSPLDPLTDSSAREPAGGGREAGEIGKEDYILEASELDVGARWRWNGGGSEADDQGSIAAESLWGDNDELRDLAAGASQTQPFFQMVGMGLV